MPFFPTRAVILAGVLAVVAGCAGSSVPAVHPQPTGVLQKSERVSLKLLVPKAAAISNSRVVHPHYISAATKSIQLDVSGGATSKTFSFNVEPTSPNCAPQAGGTQCVESIEAPLGNDAFTLSAFDGVLNASGTATGNVLSRGSVYATIVEGKTNTVRIALSGTPAKVSFSLATMPAQGAPSSVPLTFTAYDADNYALAGDFSQAIMIPCITDNTLALGITVNGGAQPWISASTDQVQLTYTGSTVESQVLHACVDGTTPIGQITITPTPTFGAEVPVAQPVSSAIYSNEGQYISEPSSSRLALLPAGSSNFEYYPIPSGGQPTRMFFVPSSWIVFTLSDNAVGWLNGGTITEHPLPTANAGLYAVGGYWNYDFSVWFTEHDAGKLAQLITEGPQTGHINEYPTGFAGSTPAGMTGYSFFVFADPGTNSIDFCTPVYGGSPTIVEHPLPTANAMPLEVSGTDKNGRFWFTEKSASKVGRIDSNGAIDEYPSAQTPVAIVVEYSAIFVLTANGNIERYDPDTGASTTITPPSSSNGPVTSISDGGNFNLYLVRNNGSSASLEQYYY